MHTVRPSDVRHSFVDCRFLGDSGTLMSAIAAPEGKQQMLDGLRDGWFGLRISEFAETKDGRPAWTRRYDTSGR